MHRIIERWLASALFMGLVLARAGVAQSPGLQQQPPTGLRKGLAPLGLIHVDDIVERLMGFDKNKDGKVTRDELPDRMHHLIELGDTNKDGSLDRDEIRTLATKLSARPAGPGGAGPIAVPVGPGPGPGAPGGFSAGGAIRSGPDAAEGVVEDLKLSGKKKQEAMAAVKAHQENVRKLMDRARAELLETMRGILSEEEFKDFSAALDRPRGAVFFSGGPLGLPPGGGPKKLDPPPK
jgi:hypothetical protein